MDKKTTETKGINRPKTQIGLNKMLRLVEAAEELFTTKGFYQTSISEICKSAKTAVGTFYIYFQTKTDIYHYMMDYYADEIRTRLGTAIKIAQHVMKKSARVLNALSSMRWKILTSTTSFGAVFR